MSMVKALLEPDYNFYQLFVSAGDVGHAGIARKRVYIYCAHKCTCACHFDVNEIYEAIAKSIRAVVQTQPQDYFVAPLAARRLQAMEICRKRKKQFDPAAW